MHLTPEEQAVGRANYYEAVGFSRRDFLKGVLATGAVSTAGLGAMYFGYEKVKEPLRVGFIGTGDEGNVLIGALNPDYLQVVAVADIRPSSIHRAFHGDYQSSNTIQVRPGLMSKYGWKSFEEAQKHVKIYKNDYRELLKNPDVEAVVIAVPLHLHAQVACDAMKAGKHVLTEKLMAHNVAQCKVMARLAAESWQGGKGLHLATGHQRHYSILYDNAVNLIQWGVLGELHHIRAQWHRGNLPGKDSWQPPLPGGELTASGERIDRIAEQIAAWEQALPKQSDSTKYDLMNKRLAQWKALNADKDVDAGSYGYLENVLSSGRKVSPLEELIRWRLWERTGGGLMAELGSHQLDAATIFISALRRDGKKAHPLSVHGVGGRHTFPADREAEDHVYCTYEFPGPGYEPDFKPGYRDEIRQYPDPKTGIPDYQHDPNKRIVVTYSSINGNGYGGYGEVVMGTKGTLILEKEADVLLFKNSDTASKVAVKDDGGGPTLDTTASGYSAPVAQAVETGPISRGYTEELEHWAWCIRNMDPENQPRCKPIVAMGDAVIALTSKLAIKNSGTEKGGYIAFDEEWFDPQSDKTPDGSNVEQEFKRLVKQA